MSLKENVQELIKMILEGRTMEAFEKFYDENVIMQENNMPPTIGKEANRKRELEAVSSITEFKNAEVKAVTIGDDVTMVEWFMHFVHKQYGEVKSSQVAVQRWKNDKIISERFYYGS